MTKNYYHSGNDVIEFIITDFTGRKLFKWKANVSDGKEIAKVLNEFADKYGLKLFIKYYGDLKQEHSDFIDSLKDFDW